jgi:hypothetical protein
MLSYSVRAPENDQYISNIERKRRKDEKKYLRKSPNHVVNGYGPIVYLGLKVKNA